MVKLNTTEKSHHCLNDVLEDYFCSLHLMMLFVAGRSGELCCLIGTGASTTSIHLSLHLLYNVQNIWGI